MAGARAGPCSTFITTDWACEPGEQAGLKHWWSRGGQGGKSRGYDVCLLSYEAAAVSWVALEQGQEMTW